MSLSHLKSALLRGVGLMLVGVTLSVVLAVSAIVFLLSDAGAPAPHDGSEDVDYHLKEQRAQGRTGAEFANPGWSWP